MASLACHLALLYVLSLLSASFPPTYLTPEVRHWQTQPPLYNHDKLLHRIVIFLSCGHIQETSIFSSSSFGAMACPPISKKKKTHVKINRWNFPEPIHTEHFSPGSPFAIFFWSIWKHPSPGHATSGKLAWFGIKMWDLTHKGKNE